jgi:hypothetical protein
MRPLTFVSDDVSCFWKRNVHCVGEGPAWTNGDVLQSVSVSLTLSVPPDSPLPQSLYCALHGQAGLVCSSRIHINHWYVSSPLPYAPNDKAAAPMFRAHPAPHPHLISCWHVGTVSYFICPFPGRRYTLYKLLETALQKPCRPARQASFPTSRHVSPAIYVPVSHHMCVQVHVCAMGSSAQ